MAKDFVRLVLGGALGIDPTAKLVLVVLAEHANIHSGGVSWPSVARIARECCVSERQVQDHLRRLAAHTWIAPIGSTTGGRNQTTRYRLNLDLMREATAKGEADRTLSRAQKGEARRTLYESERVKSSAIKGEVQRKKGEAGRAERVKPTAPEPEVEPELNSTVIEPRARARANSRHHDTGPALPLKTIFEKLTGEPERSAVPNDSTNDSAGKPRLGKAARIETEAERSERMEREKAKALAFVAAYGKSK